jgi:hypothetical protein
VGSAVLSSLSLSFVNRGYLQLYNHAIYFPFVSLCTHRVCVLSASARALPIAAGVSMQLATVTHLGGLPSSIYRIRARAVQTVPIACGFILEA